MLDSRISSGVLFEDSQDPGDHPHSSHSVNAYTDVYYFLVEVLGSFSTGASHIESSVQLLVPNTIELIIINSNYPIVYN